jgi:transposase
MAKRKFILTKEEEEALEIAYDYCAEASTKIRYQAVRLYGSRQNRYEMQEIQQICRCSVRSLLEWCQVYRCEGISGLVDKRLGGNRAYLSAIQKEELSQLLHQYSPSQWFSEKECVGHNNFWDVTLLSQVVKIKFNVIYKSMRTYHTLFADCDFSYQRTTHQYKSHNEFKVLEFEEQLEKK